MVNLQQSGSRAFIVAGGVRQHRRNVIRGSSGVVLVRLRLRGQVRIMEQQVVVFVQQVMEMTDQLRQNKARQFLEAHGTVG